MLITVKRLPTAMLAMLLLVIGIVAARTIGLQSRQVHVTAASTIAVDRNAAVDRLSKSLQFPTIAHRNPAMIDGAPFIQLHRFLENAFPRVHNQLEKRVVGNYSLIFKWQGRDDRLQPILLMSHLDVVPVQPRDKDAWSHPPFAGRAADGFVYGRGALDDKSGVMAILEAVEALLADDFVPARSVYVAMGHDEEVGGQHGNRQIARDFARHDVRFLFVLDEGGAITHDIVTAIDQPVAMVAIAEKGYADFELSTSTSGGHSSTPPAQTAIGILAAAINRLEKERLPARIGPATAFMLEHLGAELSLRPRIILANRWLFNGLVKRRMARTPSGNASMRTTMAVTMMQSGIQSNVLPTHARCLVNVRILPGDDVNSVLKFMRQAIRDPRVRIRPVDPSSTVNPSRVSNPNSESYIALAKTIREIFPDVLVAPCLAAHGTDSRYYADRTDNIYRFFPARLTARDMKRIHGIDERIQVDNYIDSIRFFIRLLRNTASA